MECSDAMNEKEVDREHVCGGRCAWWALWRAEPREVKSSCCLLLFSRAFLWRLTQPMPAALLLRHPPPRSTGQSLLHCFEDSTATLTSRLLNMEWELESEGKKNAPGMKGNKTHNGSLSCLVSLGPECSEGWVWCSRGTQCEF